MKKSVLSLVAILMINGCGSDTTNYAEGYEEPLPNGANSSTVIVNNSGDGDITINQTTVTGNGVYLYSEAGDVTFTSGDGDIYHYPDGTIDEVSPPSGTFSGEYTETECVANGYFWCPIEQACLDLPTQGSSCSI